LLSAITLSGRLLVVVFRQSAIDVHQSHLMLVAAPREEPAKFADHKQISKHRTWYYSLLINRQIAKVRLIRRTAPQRALLPLFQKKKREKRCVTTQQRVARPPDQIRMQLPCITRNAIRWIFSQRLGLSHAPGDAQEEHERYSTRGDSLASAYVLPRCDRLPNHQTANPTDKMT
jgi:hypothetical protein